MNTVDLYLIVKNFACITCIPQHHVINEHARRNDAYQSHNASYVIEICNY